MTNNYHFYFDNTKFDYENVSLENLDENFKLTEQLEFELKNYKLVSRVYIKNGLAEIFVYLMDENDLSYRN